MLYFPEKSSLTKFGHIWSCLWLSLVEKWPFCHFSTHDPPKYKNGQKWPKKFSRQKINLHHLCIPSGHHISKNQQNRILFSAMPQMCPDLSSMRELCPTQWNLGTVFPNGQTVCASTFISHHLPIANVIPMWKLKP